ncbi:MAG: hypothetical protein HQM03_11485 [Magnetococcales bacterium]|nr:hypothetical protein [Magnetococcales bacterium]
MIGVVNDLTERALAVSKSYSRALDTTTKQKVSETLDLKPLVAKAMNGSFDLPAYTVNISSTARAKAAAA